MTLTNSKTTRLLFFLLLLHTGQLFAQQYTQTVKGSVLDKAVKTPLAGVTLALLPENAADAAVFGAISDVDGHFRISDVPIGKYSLRASYLGYTMRVLPSLTVISGKELDLTIEMEESLVQAEAVVISAKADKQKPLNALAVVSTRTFSVEESQRFAAAVNDPARMASSYAGVVMPNDGGNTINIRGNSSNGLLWRMEGVEIPNPNHFASVGSSGGGVSVLSAQLLSNSDFLTGAFPGEYGNALSGVFDLRMRKGNTEKREYTFQAGFLGLDAAMEGPMKIGGLNGSYLVNYRYSTLSLISNLGVNIGDASTDFQDLSFNFWMPAGKLGTFTLFGLGGLSTQTYRGEADSTLWIKDQYKQYNTDYGSSMGTVGLTHSLILGPKTYLKTVLAGSATENQDRGDQLLSNHNYASRRYWDESHVQQKYTLSSTLNHKFNARHLLRTGAYASSMRFNLNQADWNDDLEQLTQEVKEQGSTETVNAFAQWQYRMTEKWTLNAGLHGFLFLLNNTHSIEPRVSAKYAISNKQSIGFGYGLHSQNQPLGTYFARNAASGGAASQLVNPDLGLSKAHHFVLSFDQMLPGNLHFKTEVYYQDLFKVPISRDTATSFSMLNLIEDFPAEALSNTGRGRNYGLEITFEKFLSNGLYFLLASSFYESKYKASDDIWRNTRYNGRYANSFVAGKEWPFNRKGKNRSFGINLKLTQMGGLRDTPIDLEASRAKGETVYQDDRAFELQMPAYFRLDTGFRLKRNYKKRTATLSLDIQNTTNRQNVFGRFYDTKTLEVKYYYQAPLIPVLAYKLEW
jgi:hypothetical protein